MSEFDFGVILRALPFLWIGMQLTLLLTMLAMVGGLVLGTALAMARLWAPPPFPQLAAGYVNLLRSMPLILSRLRRPGQRIQAVIPSLH